MPEMEKARPTTAGPRTRDHQSTANSPHGKHDEDDCDCGPGPGAYKPDVGYVLRHPAYTKFSSEDRWKYRDREITPGPGPVYRPNFSGIDRRPHQVVFMNSKSVSKLAPAAGPGFYNPAAQRSTKATSFSKEDRFKYMGSGMQPDSPGPSYAPKEASCCNKGVRMGPPRKQLAKPDKELGPGAYNPRDLCCKGHKPGPKFGTSERFPKARTFTPGAKYNPVYDAVRPQTAGPTMGIGKRFPKHCPC